MGFDLPMNSMQAETEKAFPDYMSSADSALAAGIPLVYLMVSCLLVAIAVMGRRRQLSQY